MQQSDSLVQTMHKKEWAQKSHLGLELENLDLSGQTDFLAYCKQLAIERPQRDARAPNAKIISQPARPTLLAQ